MRVARILAPVLLVSGLAEAAILKVRDEHFTFSGPDGIVKRYKVAQGTVTGPVNGEEFTHNGSADEYVAAAKKIHPSFDPTTPKDSDSVEAVQDLRTRDVVSFNCIPGRNPNGWGSIDHFLAAQLRDYIGRIEGRYWVAARTCSRILYLDSAHGSVWLCNDNTHAVYPPFPVLTGIVTQIMGRCLRGAQATGGQAFENSGVNVILRNGG